MSLLFHFFRKQISITSFSSFRFIIAISIGVGSIIGINSYRKSLENKIFSESKSLMGGDIQISTSRKFTSKDEKFIEANLPYGSRIRYSVNFPSMLSNPNNSESSLSLIKGHDSEFPLYGKIITEPDDAFDTLQHDEILLDHNLARNLKVEIKDKVHLGEAEFTVTGYIIQEPVSVGNFISLAPSSIISIHSIQDTGLEARGSRIRYNALVALPDNYDAKSVKEELFSSFLEKDMTIFHNTEIGSGSQKFINSTMDYISLLGLSSFFLGIISSLVIVRTRITEKTGDIAVFKCLGANSWFSVKIFLSEILILSTIGSFLGVLAGYFFQFFIPDLTGSDALKDIQPKIYPNSLYWGLSVGILIPVLLTLDSLYTVFIQSPLTAIRQSNADVPGFQIRLNFLTIIQIIIIFLAFFGLAYFETNSLFKAAIFTTILLFLPLSLFIIYRLFRLIGKYIAAHGIVSGKLRLVLGKISRNGSGLSMPTIGIGSALTILLLSIFLKNGLIALSGWNLKEKRANVFVMDLRPEQLEFTKALVEKFQAEKVLFSPVIGARLSAINGKPVKKDEMEIDSTKRDWKSTAKTREYFLSYRDTLYDTEQVDSGNFWGQVNDESLISVEKDFAKALGVGVGDVLSFNVQGIEITGKISNLRTVNWADMKPNFVVIFSPSVLSKAPGYFLGSFFLPDQAQRYNFQKELVSRYPNALVIDIEKTLNGLNDMVLKITDIINLMTYFILSSAILLLFSSLYLQEKDRNRETTLYMIVGANHTFIRSLYTIEGLLISLYAFSVASVFSLIANYFISKEILNVNTVIPFSNLIFVFIVSTLLILIVYLFTINSTLKKSPKKTLPGE
ncbi:MAG: ABC transporter permease [Leptospiraceae bacterium]|nr:ABC transporter permease [Leptospiraceae bacterium]MCP5512902.1 ABC transporter permease [Leptospiraceae bacterium]